jgi:dihydrofolate reductase
VSETEITIVAAVAENGVIGHLGQMPWRLKGDLKHFRRITMGKPVIMGRKTFDSIGKPLDGRDNIIVSRNLEPEGGNVQVAYSLEEAVRLAELACSKAGVGEICVIGGGEIYREMMPLAARLCITRVHAEPAGDTHFPEISDADWKEIHRERLERSEGDSADATFIIYEHQR